MDDARDAVSRDGGHEGETVSASGATSAAAALRAAREAQGLSLSDIAARTKITLRHVQALDRGDLAALPGRPYVLGFVRSYARAVGLDEAPLVALARVEMERSVPRPEPRPLNQFDVSDPAKTPSRLVSWLALALFIAVLAAGTVFWRSYYWPGAPLPALVPDEAATPTPAPSAPAHPAAPAPAPNGPVVFTAQEDGIWVKFYDAAANGGQGQQLLQKLLAKGESYTVPQTAVDPRIWTGRPEALSITIGGQAVPPLSDHQQTMRDVAITAQALRARGQTPPTATATPTPAPATAAPTPPRHHRRPATEAPAGDAPAAPASPTGEAAPAPSPTA